MVRIGIDINDTIRAFTEQLEYTYNKYIPNSINLKDNPMLSFDLLKYFPFENNEQLNNFLYREASLEIFGHADELHTNLINQLNIFVIEMADFGGHKISLVSREVVSAIPSTCFFLSKTACRVETIRFVQKYSDMWEDVDILITANPDVLKEKPGDKVSVKVKTTYNTDVESDFTIDSLFDFMTNNKIRTEIMNKVKK